MKKIFCVKKFLDTKKKFVEDLITLQSLLRRIRKLFYNVVEMECQARKKSERNIIDILSINNNE